MKLLSAPTVMFFDLTQPRRSASRTRTSRPDVSDNPVVGYVDTTERTKKNITTHTNAALFRGQNTNLGTYTRKERGAYVSCKLLYYINKTDPFTTPVLASRYIFQQRYHYLGSSLSPAEPLPHKLRKCEGRPYHGRVSLVLASNLQGRHYKLQVGWRRLSPIIN
jgi:hypothetical protein